jgi:ribonucleoside-triphosphate reductase
MIQVKKGNKVEEYNKERIKRAIIQSYNQITLPDFDKVDEVLNEIQGEILNQVEDNVIDVSAIENIVMSVLYKKLPDVAREYSSYKMNKERISKNPTELEKVLYMNDDVAQENANKNAELAHIKNAYLAEIPSTEAMRNALPVECLDAHDRKVVYFHDMAYSFRPLFNCELLNLEEILKGCEINSTWIEQPKSFRTACTVATQALTYVSGNTYGGTTINLLHLAKYVDVSRQKIRNKFKKYNLDNETFEKLVNDELLNEIKDGCQTLQYQCQTLCSSVGQAVFLTISVYLNEDPQYTDDLILVFKEILNQRIKGFKDASGHYINSNFPKILYFLDEDTMRGGKYYDVTKLCAECTAKRLVPDYMSVKKHLELKGICTPSMGCRALLSPYKDEDGNFVTWGRFNCGVNTLNLPYIAMENNPNHSEEIMFKNLEHYLNIAYRDLVWRVEHVAKIKAKVCPILYQYGGVARLQPEEDLSKLVYGGYATATIGYIGLYEMVYYITGENHWEGKGKELAHKILDYINTENQKMGERINVSIALYSTPSETLTDKVARACIKDFGQIGDGTQRTYITNGYHIPVFHPIDAFSKLTEEAQFSDKTAGGSISYVELCNLSNNIDVVLEIIEHIGNTCLYAEMNSEVSQCENPDCGFSGYDFKKIVDGSTIHWQCPKCGEIERVRSNFRVCGYLSSLNHLTRGRAHDVLDRVKHVNIENE